MNITYCEIAGVIFITPEILEDERGYFLESYSYKNFPVQTNFVQDNISFSSYGTIRGLHIQNNKPQGKLVMALSGCIFDVIVDLRKDSPTFKKWVSIKLHSEKKNQVYIPPGCAHGFCVTSKTAHVFYKCTEFYNPNSQIEILYNDVDLNIPWPVTNPIMSIKDKNAMSLKKY